MKRAPRSRQRHDLYAKYHDYDSEISDLLGECGIEKAFSKLKALLRKAAERTVTGLWDRFGKLIELIEPQEARNFFTSCGYDPA